MITDLTWISKIDHRISAGVVFFGLLLLLNRAPKREMFPLRAAGVLVLMCAGSWLARFAADEVFSEVHLQGLAYSVRLLMLHVLFLAGCMFCYRAVMVEAAYNGVLAMTVFEIAWNGFKTVSSLLLVEHVNTPWSLYSPAGSLISYLVYFSVSIICSAIYKKNVKEPPYHAPVHVMNVLSVIFISCLMVLEYCGQVFTGSSSALFLYYLCALLYSALNFSIILMLAMLDSFRHENRTMHDFISNKMRYYEMSHEGIVTLQTKCHDLKHQIAAIRSEAGKADFEEHLTELEDSIDGGYRPDRKKYSLSAA